MFMPCYLGQDISPIFHMETPPRSAPSCIRIPSHRDRFHRPWESVPEIGSVPSAEKTPFWKIGEIYSPETELSRMYSASIPCSPEWRILFYAAGLFAIRSRIIGSGRIGVKAAGMLLPGDLGKRRRRFRFQYHPG
jgi:hypothetical protein